MVGRLIDFALLGLKLLMFKVCVIIGISEMKFSDFSGTERVNICSFVFEEKSGPLHLRISDYFRNYFVVRRDESNLEMIFRKVKF